MEPGTGKEVCVTGGTGLIASSLIYALLQRGYKVRTTARNPGECSLRFSSFPHAQLYTQIASPGVRLRRISALLELD